MSASPLSHKAVSAAPDARAGSLALVLLRVTLVGCALALVGTLASIAVKAFG